MTELRSQKDLKNNRQNETTEWWNDRAIEIMTEQNDKEDKK